MTPIALRLFRALSLLNALEGVKATAPEFAKAWELALQDAKDAAREFSGDLITSPASPVAKRSSEPPKDKS